MQMCRHVDMPQDNPVSIHIVVSLNRSSAMHNLHAHSNLEHGGRLEQDPIFLGWLSPCRRSPPVSFDPGLTAVRTPSLHADRPLRSEGIQDACARRRDGFDDARRATIVRRQCVAAASRNEPTSDALGSGSSDETRIRAPRLQSQAHWRHGAAPGHVERQGRRADPPACC